MKIKNFLWLQNPTGMDVGVDDLGIMVKAGTTINAFQANPRLTAEQAAKSLASGSVYKRIKSKTLKVVQRAVSARPMVLDQIRQSDKPMMITQTKSSIIITPSSVLEDVEKEKFEFADYGVDDAPLSVSPPPIKNANGSVTIGAPKVTRSIPAIVAGTQDSDRIQDDQKAADSIIEMGKTKILDENGNEVSVEPTKIDEKVIVMQTVKE